MKKLLILVFLLPNLSFALCYQGSGATSVKYNQEFHDNGTTIASQPVYVNADGDRYLSFDADTYWRADDSAPYSGAYNSYSHLTIAGTWTDNMTPAETPPTFTLVTCSGGGGSGGSSFFGTSTIATSTIAMIGSTNFALAIIIVFLSLGMSGYIFNSITKRK